eukprot:5225940-Alexandrium_andersonii.AAC.1
MRKAHRRKQAGKRVYISARPSTQQHALTGPVAASQQGHPLLVHQPSGLASSLTFAFGDATDK